MDSARLESVIGSTFTLIALACFYGLVNIMMFGIFWWLANFLPNARIFRWPEPRKIYKYWLAPTLTFLYGFMLAMLGYFDLDVFFEMASYVPPVFALALLAILQGEYSRN
ncbi:MAG TPA: hypothetical protein VHQ41_00825 [Patescibacteria group bacterium]|jgi:hypothetical protein|nr:hypothetical protein [Patescibacteria group bacterium]